MRYLIDVGDSQTKPAVAFSEEELEQLTERIQNAGTEVVNAKAGAVSSSNLLSNTYSITRYMFEI